MNDTASYKLAFVLSLYFEYGGMQRSMMRIAQECVRRGHEVHVFTGGWQGERPDNLEVHLLDDRALTNPGRNFRLARKLHEAVRGRDYDCIVGFTKLPGLDVYYAGDPCFAARVEETKSAWYRLLPRYRGFARLEADVFAGGKDTEILLFAHQERDKFIRHYGTEPGRFHMLPPGINRERLLADVPDTSQRQALRAELGIGEKDCFVLNIGSRFRTKGVDRAIDALASLPEALRERSSLVVVGGDDAGPYRRVAQRLGVGDRVVFTGAREDVARFYYAADVLIHPARSENTGTTLIEAMICGLPVLVTENCGFARHVQQANAGLVCTMPYRQEMLNRQLAEALTSESQDSWRQNGPAYCAATDLYSLIEKAADAIIGRARRNREVS